MKVRSSAPRIGLARVVSKLGYCSRSQAAELIRAGRVTLNGKVRRDPETPVVGGMDLVEIDGKIIAGRDKLYYMLNKPRGVITTASDEKGRDTVYSLLGGDFAEPTNSPTAAASWIAPVGRLDKASEGLLLLTNDTRWAARITEPETQLEKTYHVQLGVVADEALLERLIRGVKAKDGEKLQVKRVNRLRAGEKTSWIEIVLDEGKNRHIRRMMEAVGIEVLRLVRVSVGPLQLGDLAKGKYRALTAEEKRMLDRALVKSSLNAN
jgi:23S rRNA pseudouridine2605 synthase